jgi:hypothetical protein
MRMMVERRRRQGGNDAFRLSSFGGIILFVSVSLQTTTTSLGNMGSSTSSPNQQQEHEHVNLSYGVRALTGEELRVLQQQHAAGKRQASNEVPGLHGDLSYALIDCP